MEIALKHEYTVYNGDVDMGRRAQVQYSNGRTGGGNGKRNVPVKVTDDFKRACANASKARPVVPKVMVVDALTGHKVMVEDKR